MEHFCSRMDTPVLLFGLQVAICGGIIVGELLLTLVVIALVPLAIVGLIQQRKRK